MHNTYGGGAELSAPQPILSLIKCYVMLILTGEIYRAPKIHVFDDGRKVVHFTVLDRMQYLSADGELKEIKSFYNCSYWKSEALADKLKVGDNIVVTGSNRPEPYTKGRDVKARNAFTVETFSIPNSPKETALEEDAVASTAQRDAHPKVRPASKQKAQTAVMDDGQSSDDLPF
jgi:single-strand DNA-binding protein